ncbi:MAG: NAD(+) diphosphatase [Chloroflexi bacterium]|nr:MAG: NAD(+) diphosphatase [Chloroflexota bacterium]
MLASELPFAFQPGIDPSATPGPEALLFAFSGDRLLVVADAPAGVEHLGELAATALFIGHLDGRPVFTVSVDAVPEGVAHAGLRELFGRLDPQLHGVAGRAYQLVEWYRSHAFCGRCGHPTHPVDSERARACEACGASYFPRINPAVIMRVQRRGRMLLARNRNFRGPFFSVLAGFVEPGEALEETVAREVEEEVGLEVTRVRYFGSQSWPFPSQLMIGFVATAGPGQIDLRDSEIEEARWFAPGDELPPLPGPFSISRRLIDDFLQARHQQKQR